jgi:hypothetical protein
MGDADALREGVLGLGVARAVAVLAVAGGGVRRRTSLLSQPPRRACVGRLTVRAAPLPPPVIKRGPCRSNGRRFCPPRAQSCAEDVSCGRAQQGRERGQIARERGSLRGIGRFHWYNTSINDHLTEARGRVSVRASWSPRGLRALNRSHGRWGLNGGKWGREGRHAGGEGRAEVCTVKSTTCTIA